MAPSPTVIILVAFEASAYTNRAERKSKSAVSQKAYPSMMKISCHLVAEPMLSILRMPLASSPPKAVHRSISDCQCAARD